MALTKNSQIDLNGNEMILDADADTSITADTDDQIDIKVGGTDTVVITGGAIALKGTTPTLTIGDAGAEDTKIVFDGNAQDYYIGLDDSADDLIIGKGSTVGTTPAIVIDENLNIGVNTSSPASNGGFAQIFEINDSSGTTGPDLMLTNPTAGTDEFLGILSFNHANDLLAAVSAKTDGATDAGHIQFMTQPTGGAITERMRILSDGKVGIGKTDPNYPLVVAGTNPKIQIYDSDGNGQTNLYFGDSGSNLAGFVIYQHSDNKMRFGTNATDAWEINSDGYFLPDGNNSKNIGSTSERVSVLFTSNAVSVSDRTLKTNIQDCDLGLDFINTLQPKSYKNLLDTDTPLPTDHIDYNKKHYGLIAQDLKDGSLSDSVCGTKDGEYSLAYNDLIAPIIKALQEADDKIEALTARITTLEGE